MGSDFVALTATSRRWAPASSRGIAAGAHGLQNPVPMASVIALPALGSSPHERSPAREAFARVFNLRNVAALFYFCLLLLAGRFVIWLSYEPIESWAFDLVRGVRQTMISAVLLLLAIACVEAFVTARRLGARSALTLGVIVSLVAAAVAVPIRVWVAGSPLASSIAKEPGYFVQVWALWAAVGGFGYWLFHTIRTDEWHARSWPMPSAGARACRRRWSRRTCARCRRRLSHTSFSIRSPTSSGSTKPRRPAGERCCRA